MLETSGDIAALLEALSAFQGQVTAPKKTSTNPHFKSKYADLAEVIETIKAPLAANGLSVFQAPVGAVEGGAIRIVTQVSHKSGQWIRTTFSMPVGQTNAQAVGTALSYARRYSLSAALGIAAEDDDGNEATKQPETRAAPQQQRQEAPAARPFAAQKDSSQTQADRDSSESSKSTTSSEPPTQEQKDQIRSLAKAAGVTNGVQMAALIKDLAGVAPDALTQESAKTVIAKMLQRSIDQKEGRT